MFAERCRCCGGPGPNTHIVAAAGYAGTGCRDCASLAVRLGGYAHKRPEPEHITPNVHTEAVAANNEQEN